MKIGDIDTPRPLLNALREQRLVIFAGAGVSVANPANLPMFDELVKQIAEGTEFSFDAETETHDGFMGKLQSKGVEVHQRAATLLSGRNPQPTDFHRDLLRIYSDISSVRIVTTNFDRLFEQVVKNKSAPRPEVHRAPALPLGRQFTGIVNVHGTISCPDGMVLTDADFGRAYLTEGWARRFLVEMFRSFPVLFVGYRHSETVMKYLARALPQDAMEKRFALTKLSDADSWRQLGIEPLIYEKPSPLDYSCLHKYIGSLAQYAGKGILDWQREITAIAEKEPSLDEEGMGFMEEVLADTTKLQFFTDSATLPEWIDWLDRRGCLTGLFEPQEICERHERLAQWLAETFVWQHPKVLYSLIFRHGMRLHPRFWFHLGCVVGQKRDSVPNDQTFSRWISLLLDTAGTYPPNYILLWLGEHCIERKEMTHLVDVFDAISHSSLYEADPTGKYSSTNKLWEKGLRPNLACVAEPLLVVVIRQLSKQYQTSHVWQDAGRRLDKASFYRQAIEPHDQNNYPKQVDVLIDAARDCLEWLASECADVAAQWCDRLRRQKAPLLRRLSIHTLSVRQDLSPDEKIEWVLGCHTDLYDRALRHELFLVLGHNYPEASEKSRKALIFAILAYRWPNEGSNDKESFTDRYHFDWLHWLSEAAPECKLAQRSLARVHKKYPEWLPRDLPSLSYWRDDSKEGPSQPQSPYSPSQLLAEPLTEEWVRELISFKRKPGFLEPSREGLLSAIKEAANIKPEWGFDLATKLASMGEWVTDLWRVLLETWESAYCNVDQAPGNIQKKRIFALLAHNDLQEKHPSHIARLLQVWMRNNTVDHSGRKLEQAREIAIGLWGICASEPLAFRDGESWFNQAINHPAGYLSEFWLASLTVSRQQQKAPANGISGQHRKALTRIAKDKSIAGRLGRCILAGQLSFLSAADERWMKTNLSPCFMNHGDIDEYQAVWDGFLRLVPITPIVAELMREPFLDAITRIQSHFLGEEGERARRLISAYTAMLAYYANDPIRNWISKLFEHVKEEDRTHFAHQIERYLQNMNAGQRREWWNGWMRTYWHNRLQGVPKRLASSEVEAMVDWLPHLEKEFPEAVKLASGMPPVPMRYDSAICEIAKSDLWQRYPDAVAELLFFIDKCTSQSEQPVFVWNHSNVSILINSLLRSQLPNAVQTGLRELVAKHRLTLNSGQPDR